MASIDKLRNDPPDKSGGTSPQKPKGSLVTEDECGGKRGVNSVSTSKLQRHQQQHHHQQQQHLRPSSDILFCNYLETLPDGPDSSVRSGSNPSFVDKATSQLYPQRYSDPQGPPTPSPLSLPPYNTSQAPAQSTTATAEPQGKPASSPTNHTYAINHITSAGCGGDRKWEDRENEGTRRSSGLEKEYSDDVFTADDDKVAASCFAPKLKGFVEQGRDCFSAPRTSSPRFARYRRQERVRTPSDDVAVIDIESHDDGSDDTVVNAFTRKADKSNAGDKNGDNGKVSDREGSVAPSHGRTTFIIGGDDSERTDASRETSAGTRSVNEKSVIDTTISSQGLNDDLDTTRGSDELSTLGDGQFVDNESVREGFTDSTPRNSTRLKGDKTKKRKLYQRRANTATSKRNLATFFNHGRGGTVDHSGKAQDSPGEDEGSGSGSTKPARRIAKRGIGMFPSSNWRRLRNTLKAANEMQVQKKPKHLLTREDSFLRKFSTRNHQTQNANNLTDEESPRAEQPEVRIGSKFVIQHDGNFMFYWLGVVTVSVLYNLWTCIARQAFREIQFGCPACWFSFDALFDLIYISDIIVQFRTGYLDQGLVVYDSRKLRDRYIKSKGIYIDVACLLPLDLLQIYIGIHPMIRFPRFLKIYRAFRFLHMLESRTAYPNLIRVASLTHILFLGAHWFAAFYYMISAAEGFPGGWAYPTPTGVNADVTRKYLKSLYWSTLTLTTIGDLPQPENAYEYVFVIVSYLIGVFVFATIVGQVGNVINNRNASRQEFERLLDGAKIYMQTHNVPHNLQKRVQRWYDYVWSRGRLNGCDINSLGLLPDKLKTELAIHVNLETLKKVTIFQECQPEFLHDLVLKMKAYIFTPGDLICRRGEVAREMFIIADGVVEIISETGVMLKRMGAGDFFGEIGILNLDGGINRRSADVRSVGYLELFVLSREDVLGALKDHPEAESIIRDYGQRRLREMEAHRQRVKPVKCQDSSDDQSIPSHTMQNRLLKTLRSLSPAVRRASAHKMQLRSQGSQSSYHNQASPGPNQKPGSGNIRCVPPQHCAHAPVITGFDGVYKSSFQGVDSSEDTTSAELDLRRRHQRGGGYLSSLYQRVTGLFRRRPIGQRRSLGLYGSCSSSKYYSPSKESHAKDTTSCSPPDSPIPYQARKCSVTVNVESCSDECKSEADGDYNRENTGEKREDMNTYSDVNSLSKEFHSGSDGESFHKQDSADTPPNGLGSKLVQVFQGKLKSNSVLYVPVCSEDPDEGGNLLRNSCHSNDEVSEDNNCTKDSGSEMKYVREEETVVPEHVLPAVFQETSSERQRTQSFTGDRFSKSVLNDKKIRALQLACVRFSFDSCDSPTGSSRSLARGISSICPSPKSRSRTPSDNTPNEQPGAAKCHNKNSFLGLEDRPKALSSVPLLDSSFYPIHSNSSSCCLQTFSNPDVSSSTSGSESKPRSESSDFRVRGTFLNSSGRLTWKASSMPPLISTPSKGLYHGQSHESDPGQSNSDTQSIQRSIANTNVTNCNKSDSYQNRPKGNPHPVNSNTAGLPISKTSSHNPKQLYETMIKNIGNNNNNNEHVEGISRKHPAGNCESRVFGSRNASYQGCNCDPAENFHQFMGKHLPEGLQHRSKHVERKSPSTALWHQKNRLDMTRPKAMGNELNKDSSCACVRRSLSLPSILDAFTVTSAQRTGTLSSRRLSTQEDVCWSSDDAKRLDTKFRKSRFSEESASCRSMDRDGSVKRGRSKAMSIIQTPASDMAYQHLSDQIHLMQDLLEKRLVLLEEANASTSSKLDRLARSHEVLLRVFSQQIARQDSTSSRLPLLPPDDDGLPASCV